MSNIVVRHFVSCQFLPDTDIVIKFKLKLQFVSSLLNKLDMRTFLQSMCWE